jgi:hypothetical protein
LEARLNPRAETDAVAERKPNVESSVPSEAPEEAVTAAIAPGENGANVWNDEAAETAFLAEARDRGEPTVALQSPVETKVESAESGTLPPLDELVQRIPADVRETLDDLFRAKFTTVRRIPKKALAR